jgi:hypothetical protein
LPTLSGSRCLEAFPQQFHLQAESLRFIPCRSSHRFLVGFESALTEAGFAFEASAFLATDWAGSAFLVAIFFSVGGTFFEEAICAFFLGAIVLTADLLGSSGFAEVAMGFFFVTGFAGAEGFGLLFAAFFAGLVLGAIGLALVVRVSSARAVLVAGFALVTASVLV